VNAQRGFDASFAAAELSDAPRAGLRMGASLWVGARLLSVGYNLYGRSHPASANTGGFLRSTHAEHMCLLRRRHYDRMSGKLTLYVARMRSDGSFGCSKPCANCIKLCKVAGVVKVWFLGYNGKAEEMTL
jgi:deoxycytidylate deaminase